MTAGARMRPSPGKPPSTTLTKLEATGGTQKSAPIVGLALPPQGAWGLPWTLTVPPSTSLPGKHASAFDTHVWPFVQPSQVPEGGGLQSGSFVHARNVSREHTLLIGP